MPESFTIRSASAGDAATLARHRVEMFRDMGMLPEPLYESLVDASLRYFQAAVPTGEYLGWLASPQADSNRIVAGAGVQVRPVLPYPDPRARKVILGPQGVVLNVYTEPAWRRRGLAALLMRRVLAWAAANGVNSLVLHASDAARSLYEQLGFVPTNEMRYVGHGPSQGPAA